MTSFQEDQADISTARRPMHGITAQPDQRPLALPAASYRVFTHTSYLNISDSVSNASTNPALSIKQHTKKIAITLSAFFQKFCCNFSKIFDENGFTILWSSSHFWTIRPTSHLLNCITNYEPRICVLDGQGIGTKLGCPAWWIGSAGGVKNRRKY